MADSRTVFVRNLGFGVTDARLEAHFTELGPVKTAWIACDKATRASRGFGFVSFALADDAARAVEKLNGSVLDGRKITVDVARKGDDAKAAAPPKRVPRAQGSGAAGPATASDGKQAQPNRRTEPIKTDPEAPTTATPGGKAQARAPKPSSSGKQFRMIVRNLSFKCDEPTLRKAFEAYGNVVDVRIPMRDGGKHPGFGFVQMSSANECKAAMGGLNERPIVGRVVAVDSALGKERFQKEMQEAANAIEKVGTASGAAGQSHATAAAEEDGDEADGEDKDEEDESEEDEEGEEEGEDEEGGEEAGSLEDGDDGEEEESGEVEDGAQDAEAEAKAAKETEELAQTIFLRSLPIEATEQHLSARFKSYGKIKYAKVVRDPATKLSRGTAFVCFADATTAERVVAEKKVRLLGHTIDVLPATDKKEAAMSAAERKEAAKSKETSRRNLHLAKLGLTQPDEPAAASMSLAERRRREAAWKAKKDKLLSTNFVVSATRLSVRNLPTTINEANLRALAMKGAATAHKKFGKPHLKQVKIVRDEERRDARGDARSRGFGFVEFERHEHSLAMLHALSDDQQVLAEYGCPNRMILVEFAVDDVQKLKDQTTTQKGVTNGTTNNLKRSGRELEGGKREPARGHGESKANKDEGKAGDRRAGVDLAGAEGGKRARPNKLNAEGKVDSSHRGSDGLDSKRALKKRAATNDTPGGGSHGSEAAGKRRRGSSDAQSGVTKEVLRSRIDDSLLEGWDDAPLASEKRPQKKGHGKIKLTSEDKAFDSLVQQYLQRVSGGANDTKAKLQDWM